MNGDRLCDVLYFGIVPYVHCLLVGSYFHIKVNWNVVVCDIVPLA